MYIIPPKDKNTETTKQSGFLQAFGTPFGLPCPQFEEAISVAQATGALDRLNSIYTSTRVTMSTEIMEQVQEEFGNSWLEVENLADMYPSKFGYPLKKTH